MGLQSAVGSLHTGNKLCRLGRFLRHQGILHHQKGYGRRGSAGLRHRLTLQFRIAAVATFQGRNDVNRILERGQVFAEHLAA